MGDLYIHLLLELEKAETFEPCLQGGKLLDMGRLKVYLTLSLNLRLVLASPTVCWPVWLLNRR